MLILVSDIHSMISDIDKKLQSLSSYDVDGMLVGHVMLRLLILLLILFRVALYAAAKT